MYETKRTFGSKNLVTGVKRDVTRKMSDLLSPVATSTKKNNILSSASHTNDNWTKKKSIKKQITMKSSKKNSLRKFSQSPKSTLHAGEPLFKTKMTNAEAHRNERVKRNNFLRASINAAGQEQVHSRGSASSSKGFTEIRKKLKRGTSNQRKSLNTNDFAFQTAKMKEDFISAGKKKLPKRKVSKSNAMLKMDGESPYMEYLPDRYREYKPKEKKYKRQKSSMSLNSFYKKMDKTYSEVNSIGPRSRSGSRAGSRTRNRLSRKGSNNKSLLKIGTLKSQTSVSSKGGKSARSNPSRLRKKPKKSQSSNDSFQQMANLIKERVLKNKNL